MLSYQFRSPSYVSDPNRDGLFGGITVMFGDGSGVTIGPRGTDEEERQRYAYSVTQDQVPRTVAAGEDLRSGVGEPVDYLKALAAWVGFAAADADTYRAAMAGDAFQEWAYQHDDELAELALELQGRVGDAEAADAAWAGDSAAAAADTDTGKDASDHAAAGSAHADYRHEPGTLYDCHECEGTCFCDGQGECVHCSIVAARTGADATTGAADNDDVAAPGEHTDQPAAIDDRTVRIGGLAAWEEVMRARSAEEAHAVVDRLDEATLRALTERMGLPATESQAGMREQVGAAVAQRAEDLQLYEGQPFDDLTGASDDAGQRACPRDGCGGTLKPVVGMQNFGADSGATVDTDCDRGCGISSYDSWVWSRHEAPAEDPTYHADDEDSAGPGSSSPEPAQPDRAPADDEQDHPAGEDEVASGDAGEHARDDGDGW